MYEEIKITGQDTIRAKKDLFTRFEKEENIIHLVMIGTKPDIIKQAPLILELKKRNLPLIIGHTGQHSDWNLSGGLEQEFCIQPDFNLNIEGDTFEKEAQIIFRLGWILSKMKRRGKEVLPYVHGDTLTAVAGGMTSFLNQYYTAHVEAGIRTLTPSKEVFLDIIKKVDVPSYYEKLRNLRWEKGSTEPYPEQFNTRATAPTAGFHFAPVELNKKSLIEEGFAEDRIFVTGNTVSDAIKFAKKRLKDSKIFEKYPLLEQGDIIRFCIHRRENVTSFHRFKALFDAMTLLVEEGRNVMLISLGATERAIQDFGFKKKILKLSEENKNFIYSPVWPFYTDVIAAIKKCAVIATDSGSMQEEANILNIPCVTLRFNSDRPESIIAGANILAPPISAEIVSTIVREVTENKEIRDKMQNVSNLYGEDVSVKIVKIVEEVSSIENIFRLEHDRLGFVKLPFWEKGSSFW